MRGRKPIIVEARRGDIRIAGTPETVGRALGYTAGYIRRLSTQHRRPAGKEWEIVEIMRPGEHRGGKTARIYAAERDGEAVSGTAVELAAVLGVVPETIRELERDGRRSRKGWIIRRTDRGFDITAGPAVE